ncbi:MAG: alpha-L-fucosidase, partial [Ktedonobacteraceae bacterium]|nr:alpha-L-fucosidase [Ktedonobacteraceae bacterium]
RFWQTDTAVAKNSWGYIQNQEYKTAASLIGDLVDIVSKNGALLLNIGPRPDGTIPEAEETILLEIGRWLHLNGEAIYGTRPWKIFGEGPTRIESGSFTDTKRAAFTSQDIRFTTREETLYATVLMWPEDGTVTIKTLATGSNVFRQQVGKVEMLGSDEELRWRHDADGLSVELPASKPYEHAFVLKISPAK